MLISEFHYSKQLFFRLWNDFRIDSNKLYKKKNSIIANLRSQRVGVLRDCLLFRNSEWNSELLFGFWIRNWVFNGSISFHHFKKSFNIESGIITLPAFAPRFFNQFLPLINASIDLSCKPFFLWRFRVFYVAEKFFGGCITEWQRKKERNAHF